MPMLKMRKNLAAQRKKNSANSLGVRVKPTGRIRRQTPAQVMKREAIMNRGLPKSATGRFRVKNYQLPQAAKERVIGTRMAEEERAVKDDLGFTKYETRYKTNLWGGMTPVYKPVMKKVKVPEQYEVSPARPAIPGSINLKRINQAHNGPRVSGAGKQKTFGAIKTMGKRGSFQSRKSKRRL